MIYQRFIAAALFLLPMAAPMARANIRLGTPFGDHMVLPQGVPVAIWGTGCPGGDSVKVSFAGQNVTTKSDWEGRWMVQLAPMKAGGPYQMNVEIGGGPLIPSSAANSKGGLELNDILVGEVVLVSASSGPPLNHTVAPMGGAANGASSVGTHPYAWVRVFKASAHGVGESPSDDGGQWTYVAQDVVYEESAPLFSAGQALYERLRVPIGVIEVR